MRFIANKFDIKKYLSNKQNIFIYGVGEYGKYFFELCKFCQIDIVAFIDNYSNEIYESKKTFYPKDIFEKFPDALYVIASKAFRQMMFEDCTANGISEDNIFAFLPYNPADNKIFLLETLKVLIDKADIYNMPPLSKRFDNLGNYMYSRSLMADKESRDLYDRLLRLLFALDFMPGEKALALFKVHDDEYWTNIKEENYTYITDKLESYNLPIDEKIFNETFVLDGYSYSDICCVVSDDIVVDCGAYIGDTALYFYKKMNNRGRIYCFEPFSKTFLKLKNNIKFFNAEDKIIPINKGLSNVEGKFKFTTFASNIGASRIDPNGETEVEITTIDIFAQQENLPKVDFIKMDIEGAECDALRGAENVIKKYRPKMAICIYHKMDDHWNVPKIILSFDPNYKFYLKHNWEFTETVLFCVPVKEHMRPRLSNPGEMEIIGELYKSAHSQLSRNKALFASILQFRESVTMIFNEAENVVVEGSE